MNSLFDKLGITPGDWHACGEERGGCVCGMIYGGFGPDGLYLACTNQKDKTESGPVADTPAIIANARLMAASKKVLSALIDATIELTNAYDTDPIISARRERGNRTVDTRAMYSDPISAIEAATGRPWEWVLEHYKENGS